MRNFLLQIFLKAGGFGRQIYKLLFSYSSAFLSFSSKKLIEKQAVEINSLTFISFQKGLSNSWPSEEGILLVLSMVCKSLVLCTTNSPLWSKSLHLMFGDFLFLDPAVSDILLTFSYLKRKERVTLLTFFCAYSHSSQYDIEDKWLLSVYCLP